jgi:CysZ protein
MISASFKALGDLLSPEFRSILLKAVGLTLALFISLLVAVEIIMSMLTLVPWPWAETVLAIGTGVALAVAFFFLMAPVTAIFAGLFLDDIALRVEARHYPQDPRGTPLTAARSIAIALQFATVVLAVNLAILPLVFTGIGAAVLVAANAYLIGREYFQMVAMRHMPVDEARLLRKENTPRIFAAGIVPALLSLVPVVNFAVPLFATSYFVHIFKQVRRSSA